VRLLPTRSSFHSICTDHCSCLLYPLSPWLVLGADRYAVQINGGAIPTITDMFEHMATAQCKRSREEARAMFDGFRRAVEHELPLPEGVRCARS